MSYCQKLWIGRQIRLSSSINRSIFKEVLRNGAQKMLQATTEQEVASFIEEHKYRKDDNGHRLAVRQEFP